MVIEVHRSRLLILHLGLPITRSIDLLLSIAWLQVSWMLQRILLKLLSMESLNLNRRLIIITVIGHLLLILNLLIFLQLFYRSRKVNFRFEEFIFILEVVFMLWIYLVLIVHVGHSLVHLWIFIPLYVLLWNDRGILEHHLLFWLLILCLWSWLLLIHCL